MPGRYTREGDVRPLLARVRRHVRRFAARATRSRSSFDASALPPLPAGWARTFLLYADGYSKEMDINSASPHDVGPLPFHAMTRYPYPDDGTLSATRQRTSDYLARYNTRVVHGDCRRSTSPRVR